MKKAISQSYSQRRTFLKQATVLAGTGILAPNVLSEDLKKGKSADNPLQISIFSKHLQFFDYEDMASAAQDIGFDGIELTVRNRGHVQPEKVEEQLPRAIEAIKKVGLNSDLMVSGINKMSPLTKSVLETAASLGIKHYRLGYFRYPKEGNLPEALKGFNAEMKMIAALNSELGIIGSYQNHSGTGVGSAMWEVWHLLDGVSKSGMGSQYDIRHAVVEGGRSWQNGLRLVKDRINTIALKDFRWEKIDGKWRLLNTPMGEGMVDFVAYFKILKAYNIHVPATIHYEYDLFGADHGNRDVSKDHHKKIFSAMKRDLELVRKWWQEA